MGLFLSMDGFEGSGTELPAGGRQEPRPGPPAGGRIHLPPLKKQVHPKDGAVFFTGGKVIQENKQNERLYPNY